MPKLRPATKKARAQKHAKAYIRAKGDINAMAQQQGITYHGAAEHLRNPDVQEEILTILNTAGADHPKFARVISEGMDAKDNIFIKRKGQSPLQITVEDHATRLKAADLYAKATRIIAPPSEKKVSIGKVLVVNLPGGLDSIL